MNKFTKTIRDTAKVYTKEREDQFLTARIEEQPDRPKSDFISIDRVFCTYLLFNERIAPEITNFLWNNREVLDSLSWNGEASLKLYYEEILNGGTYKRIKIGDDYMHSWDKGMHHDLDRMKINIMKVARELFDILIEEGLIEEGEFFCGKI